MAKTTIVTIALMLSLAAVPVAAQYGAPQTPQPPDANPRQESRKSAEEAARDTGRRDKPDSTSTKGAGSPATDPEAGSPGARPPASEGRDAQ